MPDNGYLLVVAHFEGDDNSSQEYIAWLGLAALPGTKAIKIEGVMTDSLSEFGHRAGVETSYEIHGTATSVDDKLELELESTQQPLMFKPSSPLHHISVVVQLLNDPAKCVFDKQQR